MEAPQRATSLRLASGRVIEVSMPPDQLTALFRARSPGRVGVRDELTGSWCWIELADLAGAQGIRRADGRQAS